MNIRIDQREYNEKTYTTVEPRKYNVNKDEGLKVGDFILLTAKFDSTPKVYARKKDTQYEKAGSKFNMQTVTCKWDNVPAKYEEYANKWGDYDIRVGSIKALRGIPTTTVEGIECPVIKKDDVCFIGIKQYMNQKDEVASALVLEQVTPLTAREYALVMEARQRGLKYYEKIDYEDENGDAQSHFPTDLKLPVWSYVVPIDYLNTMVER